MDSLPGLMSSLTRGPAAPLFDGGIGIFQHGPRPELASTSSRSDEDDSLESLREQVRSLREQNAVLVERIEAISNVIGSHNPARIVHDVRNVMNELVLLRKLAELEE